MGNSGATLVGTIGLIAVATILTAATMSLNNNMIERRCMQDWVASQTNQVRLFANAARSYAQKQRETEETGEGETWSEDRRDDQWETTATQVVTVADLRGADMLPPVFNASDSSRYFDLSARTRFNRNGHLQMAVVTEGLPGRTSKPICGHYRKTATLMDQIKQRMAAYYNRELRRSVFTPVVFDLNKNQAQGVYGTFSTDNPVLQELIKGQNVKTCENFQDRTSGAVNPCEDRSHQEY